MYFLKSNFFRATNFPLYQNVTNRHSSIDIHVRNLNLSVTIMLKKTIFLIDVFNIIQEDINRKMFTSIITKVGNNNKLINYSYLPICLKSKGNGPMHGCHPFMENDLFLPIGHGFAL